jgi:hypothetical protein
MKKWIADIRSGCCAVYFSEIRANCIMDYEDLHIFYKHGSYDSKQSCWNLPKIYEYQARFIAWLFNVIKIKG